jgi:uncharacterized protein YkwD
LHKAAVALLAAPIIVAVYVGALMRRSTLARVSIAVGLSLIVGMGVLTSIRTSTTVATPTTPIVPLTAAAFTTTVDTNRDVTTPVTLRFSTPMDPFSVRAALQVEPATPVTLVWDGTDSVLTIAPKTTWAAGTLHTITVQAGALARSGQPLARPARAVFLTRAATTARAVATTAIGDRVSIATTFAVSFARPVDPATVATAMWLDPMTSGSVKASDPADGPTHYTFVPDKPLLPDTVYLLHVAGVRDTDGLPLDAMTLSVRTASVPAVVRFRPAADTKNVDRAAPISVRFSKPMERRSTARAFMLSVGGEAIAGAVSWAEKDTVLLFTPSSPLPYGATVSIDVTAGARDVAGAGLAIAAHATFTTPAKPALPPAKPKAPSPARTTAVGGGSWAAVETYYLGLMNCTRTGGWVTSTGKCSSPGGRNVAPLKLDKGISSKVSRPYAKKLAIGNDCSHFIGGNPGDRLRRAGYTSYRWAENIGCRSGNPYAAVLGSHLFFQAEKSTNGGHYVNLMNAKYDRVGIGVWVSGGRVRLVIDFYHS